MNMKKLHPFSFFKKFTFFKFKISKLIEPRIYKETSGFYYYTNVSESKIFEYCSKNDLRLIEQNLRKISFNIFDNSIQVLFENEDISRHLRTEETAIQASKISSLSSTREILLPIQRFFSETSNLIADGRDMGSVVFPNANLKFFLDAAPEVRAKRRHLELQKRGQEVNMHDLINDIVERDKKDRTRDLSPLIKTEDSILLDSTNLDQESILTEALQHIKKRNIL